MKALALLLLAPLVAAQDRLRLERGDTIVFLGDSITHAGYYVEPMEAMLWSIYPELELEFFNAGVSGDVAAQAAERLDAEVLAQDPDVVFVLLGMNDAGYAPHDAGRLEAYHAGLDGIVARVLAEAEAEVVVLSPTYYDAVPVAAKGEAPVEDYQHTLRHYTDTAREVAKAHGCLYVDVNKAMWAATRAMRETDPAFTLCPDGIHPDERGGLVVADAVLVAVLPEVEPQLLRLTTAASTKLALRRRPVAVQSEAVDALAATINFHERWSAYVVDPSALPEGTWRVAVGDGAPVLVQGGEEAAAAPVEVGVFAAEAAALRHLNDLRRLAIWRDLRDEVWGVKAEPDAAKRAARYARLHTETLKLSWVRVRELERQIRELLGETEIEVTVERVER